MIDMTATTTTTASAATVAANNVNPRTGGEVVTTPAKTTTKAPAAKATTKATTKAPVTKAPATAPTTKSTHFDHTNCGHATQGTAGKKARAACRRLHAAAAKAGIDLKPADAPKPAPKAPVTKAVTPKAVPAKRPNAALDVL